MATNLAQGEGLENSNLLAGVGGDPGDGTGTTGSGGGGGIPAAQIRQNGNTALGLLIGLGLEGAGADWALDARASTPAAQATIEIGDSATQKITITIPASLNAGEDSNGWAVVVSRGSANNLAFNAASQRIFLTIQGRTYAQVLSLLHQITDIPNANIVLTGQGSNTFPDAQAGSPNTTYASGGRDAEQTKVVINEGTKTVQINYFASDTLLFLQGYLNEYVVATPEATLYVTPIHGTNLSGRAEAPTFTNRPFIGYYSDGSLPGAAGAAGLSRSQVLALIRANAGSGYTIGRAFPPSPAIGAIHFFSEDNITGLDWKDSDGSTDRTTPAYEGNMARWNGTDWVFLYNFRTLIERLARTAVTTTDFTAAGALPASPKTGDIHLFITGVTSPDWKNSDGTDRTNNAEAGEIARYDGTDWIFIFSIRTLITALAGGMGGGTDKYLTAVDFGTGSSASFTFNDNSFFNAAIPAALRDNGFTEAQIRAIVTNVLSSRTSVTDTTRAAYAGPIRLTSSYASQHHGSSQLAAGRITLGNLSRGLRDIDMQLVTGDTHLKSFLEQFVGSQFRLYDNSDILQYRGTINSVSTVNGNTRFNISELHLGDVIVGGDYQVELSSAIIPRSGGTFQGNVGLALPPTLGVHAANKKYVDDAIAAATGTPVLVEHIRAGWSTDAAVVAAELTATSGNTDTVVLPTATGFQYLGLWRATSDGGDPTEVYFGSGGNSRNLFSAATDLTVSGIAGKLIVSVARQNASILSGESVRLV